MAKHASLRASDADREQVTARLHAATVEGRLRHDEFEQRLELVLQARTFGELDRVTRDLPGRRVARKSVSVSQVAIGAAVLLVALAALVAAALAAAALLSVWFAWVVLMWFGLGRRPLGARRSPRRVTGGTRGYMTARVASHRPR